MFFRRAMSNLFAVACLLFTVALSVAPQIDRPETAFDEANTPMHEMVVEKTGSSRPNPASLTAVGTRIIAPPPKVDVTRILPVFSDRLTDSRTYRQLLCTFLC